MSLDAAATASPGTAPALPDPAGHFGIYGGRFAPEALMAALAELTTEYLAARDDPGFQAELAALLRDYAGRPTMLSPAHRFSAEAGCTVLLKREDLAHTGSHKINNVLGQVLLAQRMGKTRVIAETGAGQHGVATATACALFGLDCVVYMGEEDTQRQSLNVARMRMLGTEVIPVTIGTRTLKDAMNEAFRDWVATVATTHYCIGSVGGPHPFPMMVRDFQRVIGVEARRQVLAATGRLPGVPQARGHGPHRVAQDQQRARPGPAHQADGQDPGDRGDRRRPARRGHGHGVRPVRHGVRRVHGLGRHATPGAECLSDAVARR